MTSSGEVVQQIPKISSLADANGCLCAGVPHFTVHGCFPQCLGVPHCARGFPHFLGHSPLSTSAPHYVQAFSTVCRCSALCARVLHCVQSLPTFHSCSSLSVGVPHCERVYPTVRRCYCAWVFPLCMVVTKCAEACPTVDTAGNNLAQ